MASSAEIQTFVKTDIAPYKHPRKVVFLDAFPKTGSGKTRRFALRSLGIAEEAAAP